MLVLIQRSDLRHFIPGQHIIKQVEIGLDVIWVFGSRNDNVSVLDMPAKNDLRRGLTVPFSQFRKQRFFQQRLVSVTQRIPRLRNDTVFLTPLFKVTYYINNILSEMILLVYNLGAAEYL